MKELTKEEWGSLYEKIRLTHCIKTTPKANNIIVETWRIGLLNRPISSSHEKFMVLNCKPISKFNFSMNYFKRSKMKEHVTSFLRPFADRTGCDLIKLVDELFAKYTVDNPVYQDGQIYYVVLDYFEKMVVPHKIAVYEAGIYLADQEWFMDVYDNKDEFLRNLVRHDLSMFSFNEAFGYAYFDFKNPHPATKEAFDGAWHHHKMNNPHHPEYWLNPDRSGVLEIQKMPAIYMMEMIADWIAAGKASGITLENWLPDNLHKYVFHTGILDLLQRILWKLGIETVRNESTLSTIAQ